MKGKFISFEDREAKILFVISIIFVILIIINSVLYYSGKLDYAFLQLSIMAVYIFTAIAILYQALYTKRMVLQSAKTQAWQILSTHLYHHIAAAVIVLKLVVRGLDDTLSGNTVKWDVIERLIKNPYRTDNAPLIIQSYIKPRPGIGAGKGAEVYSAVIPSLREALSILERAAIILGEKDLGEEIEKIHKHVDEVLSLLDTKPRPTNLADTLRQLRSELKQLSERVEKAFHITITGPLLEGFHPT